MLSLHRGIWNDADSAVRNTRGEIAVAMTVRNSCVPGDALVRVVWLIYEYLFAPPVRVRMYALSGGKLALDELVHSSPTKVKGAGEGGGGEKRSVFAGLPVDDAGLLSVDHWRQWLVMHRFYLPDNAGGTEFLMKMCADDRFTVAHFRALLRENPSFDLRVTRRVRPETHTAATSATTATAADEDAAQDAAFAVDAERRTCLLLAFTRRRPGSGPLSATTRAVFRYLVYHTRTLRLPPLVAGVLLQNSDPVMRSLAEEPIVNWMRTNDGGGGEETEGDAKAPPAVAVATVGTESIAIGKQLYPAHLLGAHISFNDCHVEPVDTPLAVCKKRLRHTMLECRIL